MNFHAHDGGRGDLLRSVDLAWTRVNAAHGIVLVGWSSGGGAAAGGRPVTLHASMRHWRMGFASPAPFATA